MSKRSPAKLVRDMISYAREAVGFVEGISRQEFGANRMVYLAVTRSIEVVGEAAKGLPEDFRAAHSHIPWRKITGTRDILAHGYDILDPARLWAIAHDELPILIEQLVKILDTLEFSGDE